MKVNLLALRFLYSLLLISEVYKFANADDTDDEAQDYDNDDVDYADIDANGEEEEVEDVALRSVRDYIDILCLNWNGYYERLPDTVDGRQVLNEYLKQVSRAYARVLFYYDYDNNVISRTLNEQFLGYVIPQMTDVTVFDFDSPMQNDPEIVELSWETLSIIIHEDRRSRLWSRQLGTRPLDRRIPDEELRRLIWLRVPNNSHSRRPKLPYTNWLNNTHPNPESWPGLTLPGDISTNHLIPYQELNHLIGRFNSMWLDRNRGHLWYSNVMLMKLEIRLSKLLVLRAELDMNEPGARNLLTNDDYYLERATAQSSWTPGNLFYGPKDAARKPKPGKKGIDKFEKYAAEKLRPEGWAKEAQDLTREIQRLMLKKKADIDLREVVALCDRYAMLLIRSGSAILWALSRQAIAPGSPLQYDIVQNTPSPEVLGKLERQISEDLKRVEEGQLIAREQKRLRDTNHSEDEVSRQIEEETKLGGKISAELEIIREKKLKEKVIEYFIRKKSFQYTFTGPKDSVKWKADQNTSKCTATKMDVPAEICEDSVSLGRSTAGHWVFGDIVVGGSQGILQQIPDSSPGSGLESRDNAENRFCGFTQNQIYVEVFRDPTNLMSSVPRDFTSIGREEAVEEMKDAIEDGCHASNDENNTEKPKRKKRTTTECSREIVNRHWRQCELLLNVIGTS